MAKQAHHKKKKAFSLLEIALSLSVMAVIVLALLPLGGQIIEKIRNVKTDNDLATVALACQQYYQNHGHWPSQVGDLQPDFLFAGFSSVNYILNPQANILTISSDTSSRTVLKPH